MTDKPLSILIGGAGEALVQLLARLEACPIESYQISEPGAALAAMAANQYDLYFVEHRSPVWEGLSLLREGLAQGCERPIIIWTDRPERAIDIAALAAGAADYLALVQLDPFRLEHTIRLARNRQQLQQSEARYRRLVELSPASILIHSEGQFIFSNPAGARLLGAASPDEVIGQPVDRVIHPDYREEVIYRIEQVQGRGGLTVIGVEEKLIRFDGQVIDVEVTAIPVVYEGKQATQVFFDDITERKEAELERERLLRAERKQRERAEALREASVALSSALELDQILDNILIHLEQVLAYDIAILFLRETDTLRVVAGRGLAEPDTYVGREYAIAEADIFSAVAQVRGPVRVADMHTDARFEDEPILPHMHAWLGAPLMVRGEVIGVMTVTSRKVGVYDQAQANLAQAFANQAGIAIANARLYEQQRQHAAELEGRVAERTYELQVLYELAQALGHLTQPAEIVRRILFHLYQALPHDVAAILLMTGSGGRLVIQSQYRLSPALEEHLRQLIIEGLENLRGQKLDDMALEAHHIRPKNETSPPPLLESVASLLQVPLFIGDQPGGMLLVGAGPPHQFTADQARLLHIVADQAAESMRRVQSLLLAEYQRLESLVTHLPSGLILLDRERRIVLANPLARRFLAEIEGGQIGQRLTYLQGEDLGPFLADDSSESPLEVVSASAPKQFFEVISTPMAVGPEAGGWALVIRNVTEERANQQRIRQQERMAAVGQLAAGIAHDFNNILTSIIGYTELLSSSSNLTETDQNDLERILKQARRAANLIKQILDFAHQNIPEKRPMDLAPLLKETIKLLKRTIPENISISLDIEDDSSQYRLNADLSQLQQVLTNLAINARDAMPAGGELAFRLSSLTLRPDTSPPCPDMKPGEWLVLAVSDTGEGIPAEIRLHIFEPFFTTKSVGHGTGLGLAQVHGIIQQHGGYIQVESGAGSGTTFLIYLPALPHYQNGTQPAALTDLFRGRGELILVVEDDPVVLDICRAMLEHLDYRTVTATNGHQALQLYEQYEGQIDLVLTDITMPKMSGFDLVHTLLQSNPSLKIVGLTGYPLENEQALEALLSEGMADWLHKPLTIEKLAECIGRVLNL